MRSYVAIKKPMRSDETIAYETIAYETMLYGTIPYETIVYGTIPNETIVYGTIAHKTVAYGTIANGSVNDHGAYFYDTNLHEPSWGRWGTIAGKTALFRGLDTCA